MRHTAVILTVALGVLLPPLAADAQTLLSRNAPPLTREMDQLRRLKQVTALHTERLTRDLKARAGDVKGVHFASARRLSSVS